MKPEQKMDPMLSLAIMAAFSATQACEFTGHDETGVQHEGDAGWYMQTICPRCGFNSGVKPVCDRFKRHMTSGEPLFVQCRCGAIDEELRGCVVLVEKIR